MFTGARAVLREQLENLVEMLRREMTGETKGTSMTNKEYQQRLLDFDNQENNIRQAIADLERELVLLNRKRRLVDLQFQQQQIDKMGEHE